MEQSGSIKESGLRDVPRQLRRYITTQEGQKQIMSERRLLLFSYIYSIENTDRLQYQSIYYYIFAFQATITYILPDDVQS